MWQRSMGGVIKPINFPLILIYLILRISNTKLIYWRPIAAALSWVDTCQMWMRYRGNDIYQSRNIPNERIFNNSHQSNHAVFNATVQLEPFCKPLALRQHSFITITSVIMSPMASQITSFTIVFSTVYSRADQRKYQSSASLVFVRGSHRWPVISSHNGSVTRKMFPFDDVIMFDWKLNCIWLELRFDDECRVN